MPVVAVASALSSREHRCDRAGRNQSFDFASDALTDRGRFRILVVVDDFTRERLTRVAGTSLGGPRVVGELDAIIAVPGQPVN